MQVTVSVAPSSFDVDDHHGRAVRGEELGGRTALTGSRARDERDMFRELVLPRARGRPYAAAHAPSTDGQAGSYDVGRD